MSGATNKNKAANQTKTIIKSNTDPIKSHSDLTSNSSTVSLPSMSSQSPSTYLDPNVSPVPSRSTDTKKKSKAASKLGPVQPKSGALAAAMMAASVAGGSGFLDARKAVDESRSNALRNKKSKAALQDDTDSATLPSSTSTISGSTETNKNVSEPATDGSNATDRMYRTFESIGIL
jgi:hypothetical protein